MATPRSEQIDTTVTRYYHCISRCVRRAFLCGNDRYSGRNYDHRKEWVRQRLKKLAQLFALDICAYAVMSNHNHVIVALDEERAQVWSEQEVVKRYTTLHPQTVSQWQACLSDPSRRELLETWRSRLASVSWFMRALSENIARRANREDQVTGRFWEGRFKSQPLLDETGLLACMAYVDLNPVRAGVCDSFKESSFTSIQERLFEASRARAGQDEPTSPSGLAPMLGQATTHSGQRELPVSLAEYLALLAWTETTIRNAPSIRDQPQPRTTPRNGARPPSSKLLQSRHIQPAGWIAAMSTSETESATCLGAEHSLLGRAETTNRRFVRGLGLARKIAPRPATATEHHDT